MLDFIQNYETWVKAGIVLVTAVVVALTGYYVFMKVFERLSDRSRTGLDDLIVKQCRGPFRCLILVNSAPSLKRTARMGWFEVARGKHDDG